MKKVLKCLMAIMMFLTCTVVSVGAQETKDDGLWKKVTLKFYDVDNKTEVGKSEVEVDSYGVQYIYTSSIVLPKGYEFADKTVNRYEVAQDQKELQIDVKEIGLTKFVSFKYFDVVNNVEVSFDPGKVELDRDAKEINTDQIILPKGYELEDKTLAKLPVGADDVVRVNIKPIITEKKIVLNFFDEVNKVQVSEVEMVVSADATSVSVADIVVPEGYELTTTEKELAIRDGYVYVGLRPIKEETKKIVASFVYGGKEVGQSKAYEVAADTTVVNVSMFKNDLPKGYELASVGDAFVMDDGFVSVDVRPIEVAKDTIVNIRFVCNGEVIAGGDYTLPLGVQNYSILEKYVPEGYKMTVSGDFYVKEGLKLEVNIKKIGESIAKIQFVDENEKVIAAGDYFVDADGDGIFNHQEILEYVPEGYVLDTVGDFFVDSENPIKLYVHKAIKESIINVQFVDYANGKMIAGGDYFVDADGDGIFNYNELLSWVPQGYELMTLGDEFVEAGKTYVVYIQKKTTDPEKPSGGNNGNGGSHVPNTSVKW